VLTLPSTYSRPPQQALSTHLPSLVSQAEPYVASAYRPSASPGTEPAPTTFDAATRGIVMARLLSVNLTKEEVGGT